MTRHNGAASLQVGTRRNGRDANAKLAGRQAGLGLCGVKEMTRHSGETSLQVGTRRNGRGANAYPGRPCRVTRGTSGCR